MKFNVNLVSTTNLHSTSSLISEEVCSVTHTNLYEQVNRCSNPVAWICKETCQGCNDIGFLNYCEDYLIDVTFSK